MTDERQDAIDKDKLWDYFRDKSKLDTFRVQFNDVADRFTKTSEMLRTNPEDLVGADLGELQKEFGNLIAAVVEYREILFKNAERGNYLRSRGIAI